MKTITATELKARLQNGDDVLLLDVREPHEHAQEHIDSCILIPLGQLTVRINELEEHKNREIIVYCRSGARSASACSLLAAQGFDVCNLSGGILAW